MTSTANTLMARKTQRNFQMICMPFLVIALASFLILELRTPAKTSQLAFVLSLANGVSISAIFTLLGAKIAREKDEFQKKILLEAILWGSVTALVVSTVWGSLETFTNFHHMPAIFNFAIFLVVFAIAKVTTFSRNPVGEE